jgi:hypothetical protein
MNRIEAYFAGEANREEDLRCLMAKCVYGKERKARIAYADFCVKLDELGRYDPEKLGVIGKLREKAEKSRKLAETIRAINKMKENGGLDMAKRRDE